MARPHADNIVVVGAGAAGLMATRELGRAGRKVTILEARNRCGGRIFSLPESQFGYPAEGGAEFVHGAAPVTHALLQEAQLSLQPISGTRWSVAGGQLSHRQPVNYHDARLQEALQELTGDMSVAEFLRRHFAGPEYDLLRRSILRMVEGYDAADPERASILAVRDEWMNDGGGTQARIVGGYGALVSFLTEECRRQGAAIHLGAAVSAIEQRGARFVVRCANGAEHAGDLVILTVPPALLQDIALPPAEGEKVAAAMHVGFGNVIKLLLRFKTRWWIAKRSDLGDLTFLLSEARIPVWWTQHPAEQPVFTGWFGGPRTAAMSNLNEDELIDVGVASLAGAFGLARKQLAQDLVAARAINWANDPFARGAYSYATPKTRDAQSVLARFSSPVLLSGEAIYPGREMGTVEAALASGLQTARSILARD